MATFAKAFPFMIEHEVLKGNVNKITSDAGGKTKFGISWRFLKTLSLAEADFNHDGKLTEEDIVELTFDEAQELYERHFWQPIHGDEIAQQAIASKLLDMVVNTGVHQGVVLLQRAITSLASTSLTEDGVIGPKTLAATNASDDAKLLSAMRLFLIAFYEHIRSVRPVSMQEYESWMRRAAALPALEESVSA